MNNCCSCGNINVEIESTEKFEIARKCSCDYCLAQNPEYVSNPAAIVSFKITNSQKHKIIKHGFNSAEFHECTDCGLVLVTCSIDDEDYCVLNARVLGFTNYVVDLTPKDFSKESLDQRLSRRKENWCRLRKSPSFKKPSNRQ